MDLIKTLETFDLSKREAEVYLALLQKKEFTAPELTKITTITRTKIYEHLQNLIHKGLCNERLKNGQKVYLAVKPKIVLGNLIRNYESEIEQKRKTADLLEHELAALHSESRDNLDPVEYIEVLTDLGQIRNRWVELQSIAKYEMVGFSKPPYAIKPEENVSNQERAAKKKVKIKSIYEYDKTFSKEAADDFFNLIQMYLNIGEEARVIDFLPVKMIIIDEKITMLALNDPVSMKPSITTIIINHPEYAMLQKKAFDSYWESAKSVKEFKRNLNKLNSKQFNNIK